MQLDKYENAGWSEIEQMMDIYNIHKINISRISLRYDEHKASISIIENNNLDYS